MNHEDSRKKELKIMLRRKKKREQRDWRLTMKRLRKFQKDVLNERSSRD
ncbi:hypothetical protein [Halalkalibacter alkaliphilus]|uniref:Uncharacterized protein n=1 Tax=Halalkalibacter alkaliphilus TaxID=2917993 RepID=A0A9X2CSM2_9BACI|nr:hypothetical protein [Halalkalibacter alkaliphilus]MCL7747365.1 hypothetical protein [Halalkalibacter alkaliphilus]